MQALYDSAARAIAIHLADDARQDRTDEVAPGAIAGLRDDRVVEVELLAVGSDDDHDRIALIADRYGLDGQAITAALRAAVAAPDREITVAVADRR
ncbi:MAG: hypothetical protein ITG02_10590 [Patulibacter sp.]|nr:hypothetical protein [Patulibacter sp.]